MRWCILLAIPLGLTLGFILSGLLDHQERKRNTIGMHLLKPWLFTDQHPRMPWDPADQ